MDGCRWWLDRHDRKQYKVEIISTICFVAIAFIINAMVFFLKETPFDPMDISCAITAIVGIVAFGIYLIRYIDECYSFFAVIVFPILVILLFQIGRWIPGYTDFEIAKIIGFLGLILIVYNSNTKWVYRTLLLVGAYHILVAYSVSFDWGVDGSATTSNLIWGIPRSHIIYGTIVYAGMMAAYKLFMQDNPVWKWASAAYLVAGVLTIFHLYSNAAIGIMVLSPVILLALNGYRYTALLLFLAGICAAMTLDQHGFTVNSQRMIWWNCVIKESVSSIQIFLSGHGAGSWPLYSGLYGENFPGHPHNEVLNILFDYGFIGLLYFLSVFILILFFSKIDPVRGIALLMIVISTGINSARYPFILFLIAVYAGLCLKGSRGLFDETAKDNYVSQNGRVVTKIVLGVCLAFFVFVSYEQMRSDIAVSKSKNKDNLTRVTILEGHRSLEARYFQNIASIMTLYEDKYPHENQMEEAEKITKTFDDFIRYAPGYKDMPKMQKNTNNGGSR